MKKTKLSLIRTKPFLNKTKPSQNRTKPSPSKKPFSSSTRKSSESFDTVTKNYEPKRALACQGSQTVDKVRGDAADFSCAEVLQIQYLSGIEALFLV